MSYILISFYDDKKAINTPKVSSEIIKHIVTELDKVCLHIGSLVEDNISKKGRVIIGIDGYIGVEWNVLIHKLKEKFEELQIDFKLLDVADFYKPSDYIENMIKPFLTCDPHFGRIFEGEIEIFLKGEELKEKIKRCERSSSVLICFGCGMVNKFTADLYDIVFYVDITKEVAGKRVLSGLIQHLGNRSKVEDKEYAGKRLYYVDFPVLDRHKKKVLKRMDFYLDGNNIGNLIMLPRNVYKDILFILSEYPLRLKPIYLEGVWGGLWLKEVRKLPKFMRNCAWSYEVMAPYQSLIVKLRNITLNIPFLNLLWEHPDRVMGKFEAYEKVGGNFPIRVNYDDSMAGGDMAIQVHGNLSYLKENFNEPIGQNESYYIVATGPGSKVYLGLKNEANVEKFHKAVLEAEIKSIPFDHNQYVNSIQSREGDLFLIPAGTIHASGYNQVVLEISDTTDLYTFHFYDYLRPDLDGKLRPIHSYHAFRVLDPTKRANWVYKHLKVRPKPIRSGPNWVEYFLGELGELHIMIHRLEFLRSISDNTNGKFHILTLVDGEQIIISSKSNPDRRLEVRFSETALVPACFGEYLLINMGISPCKVVKAFMR